MEWYQMWVSHKDNAVEIMKHCDPILQRFGSVPAAPDGIPILKNGTIEVRSYNETGFRMAKRYLQDQGFIIEREQENE